MPQPRSRSSLSSAAALQCLQSPDIVHLCASYLRINELLQASTLSRSLHALYDSEAVWRDRLRQAVAVQYAPFEEPELSWAVLSSAQLAALPALPSLSTAAALCLEAFVESEQQRRQDDAWWESAYYSPSSSCLTAILYLPFTLAYHARIITPQSSYSQCHRLSYIQFELQWSQQGDSAGQWTVSNVGPHGSGWRAVNIADNVSDEDQQLNAQFRAASGVSSKARYLDLVRCSEHTRTGCRRLVPPAEPLHEYYPRAADSTLPPVCPLPLCSFCLPIFAHCVAEGGVNENTASYTVQGVIRISRTEFEVATRRENHVYRFRVSIHDARVVAHYGSSSARYNPGHNVCDHCHSAILKAGAVHAEYCSYSKDRKRR